MKYLLWILGCMGIASWLGATQPITPNISSFTKTNDTTACIVLSTGPGGSPVVTPQWLDKIIVASTAPGGALTVFNSTWTNTPVIASVSFNTAGTYNFQDTKVVGLCYTTVGNTNGITILYKK